MRKKRYTKGCGFTGGICVSAKDLMTLWNDRESVVDSKCLAAKGQCKNLEILNQFTANSNDQKIFKLN
jgi:hypothetical protein